MSYHHLNFEDRTALMLESRKKAFQPENLLNLLKDILVRSIVSLKEIASMTFIKLNMLLITLLLDVDVVTENSKSIQSSGNLLLKRSVVYGLLSK
ncbi:hypothetical protein BANRA_02992 [Acinetobacter baumannii]|nr:hypothetical protein BANRA_02992 [Acinetobacter baumannii]